jgi:hypothetical protein
MEDEAPPALQGRGELWIKQNIRRQFAPQPHSGLNKFISTPET